MQDCGRTLVRSFGIANWFYGLTGAYFLVDCGVTEMAEGQKSESFLLLTIIQTIVKGFEFNWRAADIL